MDLCAPRLLLLLLCVCGLRADEEILPKGPLNALVGATGTFKTLLNNPAFTVIVWNFNNGKELSPIATLTAAGTNVDEKYTGRANIDRNGTLTLTGLTAADSGEYSINFIDAMGKTRAQEIDMRVMEPVSAVAITSNVPEAFENATKLVLTCSAKGSFLTFQWLNATMPITADGTRLTFENTDTSSKLSLSSVYRTDLVGPLFCSVTNPLSSGKSDAFSLTVYYGPEQVAISPASPPAFVASKSNFSLKCGASSKPDATFNWYKDEVKLAATGPTLTLKDIEASKGGGAKASYTCKASNSKTGKTEASAPVTFAVIEPITGLRVSGPTGKLFAGNGSASLRCAAATGSMPTVKWLKNGAALSSGGRVTFDQNMTIVVINPVQKEDNGEFTCEMSNPVSKDTAKVKLTVFYGPEPVALSGESEVEVTESVMLECSASSVPPANYTWKFNGTKTSVTSGTYVIEKATFANTGTYTCEAYNAVTKKTATKSHFLTIFKEGELDEGLSDGAIAGIVIGVLAAVALAIGLFIYCRQKVPMESPY